jgi:hypothetical protein
MRRHFYPSPQFKAEVDAAAQVARACKEGVHLYRIQGSITTVEFPCIDAGGLQQSWRIDAKHAKRIAQ